MEIKSNIKSLEGMDIRFMPFGNRQIIQRQVTYLKLSILKHGISRGVQAVYTNIFGEGYHYYILDGQHLYRACLALGAEELLQVYVDEYQYLSAIEMVSRVAQINSDQRGWRLANFILAYASTNQLLDYNMFQKKYIDYGLTYQLTAMIYGGLSPTTSSQMIKAGTFKIVDEHKGDEIAKILQDVVLLFGRANNIILKDFTFAFYNWYNSIDYNHDRFMAFVIENKHKITSMKFNDMELFLQTYNH